MDNKNRVFRFREFPGKIYMALLAKHIAERYHVPVLTDDIEHHLLLQSGLLAKQGPDWFIQNIRWREMIRDLKKVGVEDPWELLSKDWGEAERILITSKSGGGIHMTEANQLFALCNLALESIGINNVSEVSPKTIVKIRRKYGDERKQFFKEMQKFVDTLSSQQIQDPRQISAYAMEKSKELMKSRKEYEKALRSIGLETAIDILKVSLSIPIVEKLADALTLGEPFVIAVAGTIGISATMHKLHQQLSELRKDKPIPFYLMQLEHTLDANSYFKRVSAQIRSLLS